MSQNNESGEKTFQPTRKRLRDMRKKGLVPKNREIISAAGLLGWLIGGLVVTPFALTRFTGLMNAALSIVAAPSTEGVHNLALNALAVLASVLLACLLPPILIGLTAGFIQTGPVFSLQRMKFDTSNIFPANPFSKIINMDNIVEMLKSLIKLLFIGGVFLLLVLSQTGRGLKVGFMGPAESLADLLHIFLLMIMSAAAVSVTVGLIDALYQRYSFLKKMRMSPHEMKQDHRETEGDPVVKSRRKSLHKEWANTNAVEAARGAIAVVTNPTRIAVALDYSPDGNGVPTVSAKGMGLLAAQIREVAHEAEVPIIENVELARSLYELVELEDGVPEELFTAVAEVIVWATRMRGGLVPLS